MYKNLLIILSLFSINLCNVSAQEDTRCGFDAHMEKAIERDSSYQNIFEEIKRDSRSMVSPTHRLMSIVIATHVIIVHPPGEAVGSGSNLSLAHINSQIDVLNEDFRRTNADAINTPSVFSAVDTNIEFCLASVDPNGNPTDGVTRYPFNGNFDNNEFSIKSATGWDRNNYLNIWVSPTVGALGYAYVPSTTSLPNATLDGCVIRTSTFGGAGFATNGTYNLGRTSTHEIGHYLGLSHVWGGGCGSDDGIADTPNQQGSNFGCPNHPSTSCGNTGDMFMNYMDYVDDDCMNAFTQGQSTLMNSILSTSRSSLLFSSTNCQNITPLISQVAFTSPTSCFEYTDGSVEITSSGGSSPYTYTLVGSIISNNTGIFTDLASGSYTINVTDNSGQSVDLPVTIGSPDPVSLYAVQIANVDCAGNNTGNIALGALGGNSNSYQFSFDGQAYNTNNFYDNLTAGAYFVEAIDINNCLDTMTFFVEEPDSLMISIVVTDSISCFSDANATLEVIASGGTPSYEYSLNNQANQTDSIFQNLDAGLYTLFAYDLNGCSTSDLIEISQPDELKIDSSTYAPLACSGDLTDLVVYVQGGTGPMQFSLDGGTPQTSGTFLNLSNGNYLIGVLDANDCLVTQSVTIESPDSISITELSSVSVECFGDTTGSIEIQAEGNGPFSYSLNGENNSTGFFDGLTSQEYTINISDAKGCQAQYTFEIDQMSTLNASLSISQNLDCWYDTNATISLNATGGNGIKEASINGSAFANVSSFDNLGAGTYQVVVQDETGCQSASTIDIIAPDTLVIISLDAIGNNCFGDQNASISIIATGGTGLISYVVNGIAYPNGVIDQLPQGVYALSVTDEIGCSITENIIITDPPLLEGSHEIIKGSNCDGDPIGEVLISATGGSGNYTFKLNGQSNTTGVFEMLSAGSYAYEIEDQNQCLFSDNLTVATTSDITAMVRLDNTNDCTGDMNASITVTAAGGTGSYVYGLNGSSNTSGIFENLEGGIIEIVVTDTDGCFHVESYTVPEPDAFMIMSNLASNISCAGAEDGLINLQIEGGTGNLNFAINGNNQSTGIFPNLAADSYEVIITDENGCSLTQNYTITEPEQLILTAEITEPIDCVDGSTAIVQMTAVGGTGNIIYSANSQENNSGLFELAAGEHLLMVSDENGCSESYVLTIDEENFVGEINQKITNITCAGSSDGTIELDIVNPGNYTFLLEDSPSNNTGIFTDLSEGNYQVSIIDESGCESVLDISITQPDSLVLIASTMSNTNCANCGTITLASTGGTPPYQYRISGGSFTDIAFIEIEEEGTYLVETLDALGCTTQTEIDFDLNNDIIGTTVSLYPNPSFGQTTVKLLSEQENTIEIRAYDTRAQYIGKVLPATEVAAGENKLNLDINDFAAGVYIFQIDINGSNYQYLKFIKL